MQVAIYRDDSPHLETREEINRENERRRAVGRQQRNPVIDPPRTVDTPQYSLEPFTPDDTPHLTVGCPDWYELQRMSSGALGLFPNGTERRAGQGFSAWEVVEYAGARRYALFVVEPPLRAAVHVGAVRAGGASGRVYDLAEVAPFTSGDVRITPDGTITLVGPAGGRVVDRDGTPVVSVPVGARGASRFLTAAEAVELAMRKVGGFTEESPRPLPVDLP